MILIASLLLSQVPNGQRIAISQSKGSGTLPYSIEIPKAWVKGGTWPHQKGGDPDIDFQCGPDGTMTLSLTSNPAISQYAVSTSYGVVKKKHPNQFWSLEGPLGKGVMIDLAVHGAKRRSGAQVDSLVGKFYVGNHRVVFFQWGSTSHAATASDRKLVTAIVESLKPKK
jgi:hypothetical protein